MPNYYIKVKILTQWQNSSKQIDIREIQFFQDATQRTTGLSVVTNANYFIVHASYGVQSLLDNNPTGTVAILNEYPSTVSSGVLSPPIEFVVQSTQSFNKIVFWNDWDVNYGVKDVEIYYMSSDSVPALDATGWVMFVKQQYTNVLASFTHNVSYIALNSSKLKTSVSNMNTGDWISCEYTATSNALGTFANLGSAIKSEIPVTSSATPDGSFYFIKVGEDYYGRSKLIADRNVQHSISWDTLNTEGVATGTGVNLSIGKTLLNKKDTTYIITDGFTVMQNRTGGYFDGIRSNFTKSSGKWYWEIKCDLLAGGLVAGVCDNTFNLANSSTSSWIAECNSNKARALKFYGSALFYPGGTSVTTPTTGSIIAFAMDLDDAGGTLKMYINNVLQGTMSTSVKLLSSIFIYAGLTSGGTDKLTVNFGQVSFAYTPPSGYTAIYSNPNSGVSTSVRLLTGGTTSTDTDNEWNQIIVSSTLNGNITAGDDTIWHWTESYIKFSTIVGSTYVYRGGGSITQWFSGGVTTSTAANEGFRPVLLVENLNASPTSSNMAVDDTSITTESVTLTGSITDVDAGQQVQYRILINAVQYADWTSLANPPVSINSVITASNFTTGANTITVEFRDSLGGTGTSWVSPTITKTNAPPQISANSLTSSIHNTNATLQATLTDPENETIQYRILINAVEHLTWTSLASSPVNVNHVFIPSDLNWGSNTITLEYKDSNANLGSWSPTVTKTNATPTNDLAVDTTSVHNSSITLSGNIYDADGDTLQYRILLDAGYHYPDTNGSWTTLAGTGTVAISHVFTTSDLSFGDHTISVEYKDQYGLSGTTYSQEVSRTNSTPTFSLTSIDRTTRHLQTVRVIGTISDTDGDTLRYRIKLDSTVVSDWTSLSASPVAIDRTFTANELGTASKTITIEYEDQFGQAGTSYTQLITFTENPPVIDVAISNPTTTDTTGIYADSITLTGSITEPEGDNVRYRITINGTQVKSWTSYNSAPMSVSESFTPSDFTLGSNTLILYAEDNVTGSSSRTYTVYKRDWELTYIDSGFPTTKFLGTDHAPISTTQTMLVSTGTIDALKGYLKQAVLTLRMKTQASGTVKVAKINSAWDIDTVTFNTKPTIDTANAVDITFANTSTQSIDLTSLAGTYGVAFYTTTGSFDIDYQGNSASILYYPTKMIQPEDGLGDGIKLTWQPIVFGDLHGEAYLNTQLIRSESSNFASPTTVYTTTDSGVVSYEDTNVALSKTYYYKIQLNFTGYPTVNSDYIFVETPADLLHREYWDGDSYEPVIVEGLMFHDTTSDYYSTNKGLRLKYLTIPLINAGGSSTPTEVRLDNTFDTTVTGILVTVDRTGLPFGVDVRLSKTSDPFADLDELSYASLNSLQEVSLFVKVTTTVFSVGAGTFNIRVKGTVT